MRIFYIILLLVVVIAVAVFAGQNSTPITVAFFGLTAHASMSVVLVITFAAGILLGMLLLLPSIWKRMRALSVQKKKTRIVERQLKEVANGTANDADNSEAPDSATGAGQTPAQASTGDTRCADSADAAARQEPQKPSKGSC